MSRILAFVAVVAAIVLYLAMIPMAHAGGTFNQIGYRYDASQTYDSVHDVRADVYSDINRGQIHVERHRPRHHHVARSGHREEPSVHVGDLISTLQTKVREILGECHGTHLVSAYRPGARVAGSGHPSLHSAYPSRAADLSGSPACIYAHLTGWLGGYSTDYGAVRHVHVSYSPPGSGYLAGREWHARFAHYGHSGRHARHYAARHRHHYRISSVR